MKIELSDTDIEKIIKVWRCSTPTRFLKTGKTAATKNWPSVSRKKSRKGRPGQSNDRSRNGVEVLWLAMPQPTTGEDR
jgi:hypothetical protein